MTPNSLLIANRGEIAIRIMRAAAEMGIRTVAVFPDDDSSSLHTRKADEARRLSGAGAAAYLDGEQIIAIAKEAGCDAIHPGYGFLSENAGFARRCADRGNHVRRTARRDARSVRRQGAGARARRTMRRADPARHLGRDEPRQARELLRVAGRRRIDHDQGGRGRRRPRHACRLARRRNRGSLQALPVRGARVVRQRRRVRRAADAARASHRSADHRRRLGRRQPSVGARMQHPAPQSEDRRDRAEPGTRARDARSADRRRGADGEGSALRQSRHLRVSRQRRCVRERRGRLRVHRGQSAPAGRAHGHRRSHGHRSRQAADSTRVGQLARGTADAAGGHSQAARIRDAGANQHGIDARRRQREAGGRHDHRVRVAVGTARADRYVRLCRIHDQPELRFAARQAHCSFALGGFRRRGDEDLSRAVRIQNRGRADQHRVSAEPAAASGVHRESRVHALRRGQYRGAGRRRGVRAIGGCSSIVRQRLPERSPSRRAGVAREQRSTRAIRSPCFITANPRATRRRRLPRPPRS